MDNLDLLIEKFKEAKEELQKSEETENLDKAYVSSYSKYGSAKPKKATKPTTVTPPKVTTSPVEAPKPSTIVAEDQKRAKTGVPTMNKGEDDMEKASAAGIRGTPGGALRQLPRDVPPVGSAAGVRGTPAGQVRQLPHDVPAVGSAAGVRGTPAGQVKQLVNPAKKIRGTLMRSEEVVKFDKNGQWSLDKAAACKAEDTEKMDGSGSDVNVGTGV